MHYIRYVCKCTATVTTVTSNHSSVGIAAYDVHATANHAQCDDTAIVLKWNESKQ